MFGGLGGAASIAGTSDGQIGAGTSSPVGSSTEPWPDFQIIMWQDQTPARLAGLARLGITAGSIHGRRGPIDSGDVADSIASFHALGLRWYVENIATDFYSAYHRWFPDHPVTWQFDQAKRLHQQDPSGLQAFVRTPSLSDPVWLGRIAGRLKQHVQAFGRPRPLFYNLADEAGVGDLAAAWDFDFAPASLDGMRTWLRQRYGTLAALNREWGSQFPDWSVVLPMTTDQALQQPDENFAAWADFKAWMDVSFARAVRAGTDAIHSADPGARAALEGGQIPGWGGYDYSRLTSAVDLMEMYDFGNNIEIARSLDPRLVVLQTSSLADEKAIHTIWHEVLLGGRGLILWDEDGAFVNDEGEPSERGRTLGTLATELRSGLVAQLIASRAAADPVAILYSPASLRVEWLLDRKASGKPWAERDAQAEYDDDNPVRATTRRAAALLTHLGVSPQWLTGAMIEHGELERRQIRVLVLPHTLTLSAAEAGAIRAFVAHGGTVLSDFVPGAFDEHGRRLAHPSLDKLIDADDRPMPGADLLRAEGADAPRLQQLRQIVTAARAAPAFQLRTADGGMVTDVDIRVFHGAGATIIGLQRDWVDGGDAAVRDLTVELPAPAYLYDLRHPGPPLHAAYPAVALDGINPAIFAITPTRLPAITLKGPRQAPAGSVAAFTLSQSGRSLPAGRVVRIETVAPDGTVDQMNSENLTLRGNRQIWHLALAKDAIAGDWIVRLVDPFGGHKIELKLSVRKT